MKLMGRIINGLKTLLSFLFAYMYDVCVTYPVTKGIYSYFLKVFGKDFKGQSVSMLDIGTGTGTPLKSILKKTDCFGRVLAIDINREYLVAAKDNLKKHPNVEVRYQDFMEMAQQTNEKFDIVFFGMSFMLMPDQARALEVARSLLKPGGKVYMFLTLYHKKNRLAEFIKPKMKWLFSIEFGKVIYYNEVDYSNLVEKADPRVHVQDRKGGAVRLEDQPGPVSFQDLLF